MRFALRKDASGVEIVDAFFAEVMTEGFVQVNLVAEWA